MRDFPAISFLLLSFAKVIRNYSSIRRAIFISPHTLFLILLFFILIQNAQIYSFLYFLYSLFNSEFMIILFT